ncbi:MAG: Gfo/Idh/MocA family oxidoreductase [Firmicutes bacterium]|nr:Gfo/Idh/MocA family oxidoreductase [Bacillota bacterium]
MENQKIVRIGIVGCGGMGGGHAIAIQSGTGNAIWNGNNAQVPGFDSPATTDISKLLELAGIVDIDPARQEWAKERGMKVYPDYQTMLDDPAVDAILIATPNHLHKEEAIQAMRAGKHVLCEKPVMLNSDELLEVMEVSKETGMVFYPRQNREWDEDFLIVKKIYEEKLLGNVFNIKCRVMGSRGIPGDWRGVKAYGGGMMMDWGVHIIDRIVAMMPEKITKIYCDLSYITNPECDDGLQVTLTFESGLRVNLEVGTCHFVNEPLWCVYGDMGSAEILNWKMEGRMVRLKSWDEKDTTPILAGAGLTKTMAPRTHGNSVEVLPLPRFEFDHNTLYANFANVCNGKAKQIITQEHALRVLRVMEACFKSYETGETVKFEA